MAKAKVQEHIISAISIPDRKAWSLETIIDTDYVIKIVVSYKYTGMRWQIHVYASHLPAEDLMIAALTKINEVDPGTWPNIDIEKELQNPFWYDYASELPNIIIAARVLFD